MIVFVFEFLEKRIQDLEDKIENLKYKIGYESNYPN